MFTSPEQRKEAHIEKQRPKDHKVIPPKLSNAIPINKPIDRHGYSENMEWGDEDYNPMNKSEILQISRPLTRPRLIRARNDRHSEHAEGGNRVLEKNVAIPLRVFMERS